MAGGHRQTIFTRANKKPRQRSRGSKSLDKAHLTSRLDFSKPFSRRHNCWRYGSWI